MPIVNVTEYANVLSTANGVVQIPVGEPLACYDIAIGASSANGGTLQPGTRLVRINTDVTCRVLMAVGATALAPGAPTSPRFSAGQTEYWGVAHQGMQVACITST
jgi:hypothetical protein